MAISVSIGYALYTTNTTHAASQLSAKSLVDEGATSVQMRSVVDGTHSDSLYGVQNMSGQLIQNQSPFRAGSVTKPMIATVMMQLVDENKVKSRCFSQYIYTWEVASRRFNNSQRIIISSKRLEQCIPNEYPA